MRKLLLTLLAIFIIQTAFCLDNEAESITISTSYHNLLSNPDKTGMLDLILTEAFRRIGIKAEIEYTSTANSLADVNNGLADAEMNRIEGMEAVYPNLVMVKEPNMIMDFVAFSKENFEITGWNSLRDMEIGLVKGWKIFENNTRDFPGRTLTPTEVELFRMLDKGRLDLALYCKLTGYSHLKRNEYSGISHLEPPLAQKPMYLYLHKSKADLAAPLSNALKEMKKDGTYGEIAAGVMKDLDE